MQKSHPFLTLVASVLVPIISQSQINDFGLWASVGLEKNIGKWKVEANGNIRSKDESKQLDRLNLEIEGRYSIYNTIKIGSHIYGYNYAF